MRPGGRINRFRQAPEPSFSFLNSTIATSPVACRAGAMAVERATDGFAAWITRYSHLIRFQNCGCCRFEPIMFSVRRNYEDAVPKASVDWRPSMASFRQDTAKPCRR